ncbi:MAG: DNA primase [Treponema sp.]|nr:DNA primase [Treponema sp.]
MAGSISKATIDAVSNTDIVSIVNEYVTLTKKGGQYWGCCPFHNEKTPSFSVNADDKFFYCFGCHAHGNVIKFVMDADHLTFPEAVLHIAKKHGIEVIYDRGSYSQADKERDNSKQEMKDLYNRTAAMFNYLLTQTPQGKTALEYITARGITPETIEKFKLGFSPEEPRWLKSFLKKKNYTDEFLKKSGLFNQKYPDTAFFRGRFMFPIFDKNGDVVAFGGRALQPGQEPKYLNSGELAHYHKRETLYAFNFAKKAISDNKKVILCEGYMDAIAYHQCGIGYAVAPLGTAFTEDQLKLVSRWADTVLLSFDSDGAGQTATQKAIYMCRKMNLTVKVIILKGAKDPAEIMVNFGPQTLTTYVDHAILDNDFLLSKLLAKYSKDSPEGKIKAALEFFPYVDSINSYTQKDAVLEQFAQVFNTKVEAVKKDYLNRAQAQERLEKSSPDNGTPVIRDIKLNAELRTILAVISNLEQFSTLQSQLSVNDFEDPLARQLFIILEECFAAQEFTIQSVLEHCQQEEVRAMITKVIMTREFGENASEYVQDSIAMIKRNSLERRREKLMERIRTFLPITPDDQKTLEGMIQQKMEIDQQLK